MSVYFLSDLHLERGDTEAARRFEAFLRGIPGENVLLLGGDIFDLLVGNKEIFRARFAEVLTELRRAAARGVRVHYLEGNHDFHFDGMFAGVPGLQVHRDEFPLTVGEHRIWVSHGDLIDEEDTGYRLLRAVTKNAPFRLFVASLPGAAVDLIGSRSSGASRKYTTGRVETEGTERIRRLYLDFARGKVREGYQHVLVGHSHLADHVAIEESGRHGEYVNLGFRGDALVYAVLEPGAERFVVKERG